MGVAVILLLSELIAYTQAESTAWSYGYSHGSMPCTPVQPWQSLACVKVTHSAAGVIGGGVSDKVDGYTQQL